MSESCQEYAYSYGVVQTMIRAFPGCLDIDWDSLDDEAALVEALRLVLPGAEVDGLEDERLDMQAWFAAARPRTAERDLPWLIELLERSGHSSTLQAHLYDGAEIPVRYALSASGTARGEIALAPSAHPLVVAPIVVEAPNFGSGRRRRLRMERERVGLIDRMIVEA